MKVNTHLKGNKQGFVSSGDRNINTGTLYQSLSKKKRFPRSFILKMFIDTGDAGLIPGLGNSLEEEVASHSNILT